MKKAYQQTIVEVLLVLKNFESINTFNPRDKVDEMLAETILIKVPVCDIIYIKSSKRKKGFYVVRTQSGVFYTKTPLTELESILPSRKFYRVHRQTIVNLSFVYGINRRNNLVLQIDNDKIEIHCSRRKKVQIKKVILNSEA
ncbi:MAG: LytTR family transcriptional regulator [Flavobacteriales bacterium]|jgi:DNA-binding LytR/AlgR family response regulator|nr:LytTR family transcriptional regulator [Flavobacteriales bacterium]